MKIKVRGIPADGLQLKKSVEPSELGLSEEDIACVEPFDIVLSVERILNVVVVQAQLRGKFSFSCVRCLEEVEKETEDEFKFEYPVENDTEFIDVGEDIRQEIIISLPAKVLCKEDCRGLCLHCGANLNEEECSCGK